MNPFFNQKKNECKLFLCFHMKSWKIKSCIWVLYWSPRIPQDPPGSLESPGSGSQFDPRPPANSKVQNISTIFPISQNNCNCFAKLEIILGFRFYFNSNVFMSHFYVSLSNVPFCWYFAHYFCCKHYVFSDQWCVIHF